MSLFQCQVGKWILRFRVWSWIHVTIARTWRSNTQLDRGTATRPGDQPLTRTSTANPNEIVAQPTKSVGNAECARGTTNELSSATLNALV